MIITTKESTLTKFLELAKQEEVLRVDENSNEYEIIAPNWSNNFYYPILTHADSCSIQVQHVKDELQLDLSLSFFRLKIFLVSLAILLGVSFIISEMPLYAVINPFATLSILYIIFKVKTVRRLKSLLKN